MTSSTLIKEEAKRVKEKVAGFIKEEGTRESIVRALSIYAGMLTETLLEYEEPDIVMEAAFHRISDLIQTEPYAGDISRWMPIAYDLDRDVEVGRALARKSADKLPKYLDDVHEIAIAMIISDLPEWHEDGYYKDEMLLLLVEMVISAVTFEMATQEFCDILIEDFIQHEDHTVPEALTGLSVVAGSYIADSMKSRSAPYGVEEAMVEVMVREAKRHGTPGTKQWLGMTPSNDVDDTKVPEFLKDLKPRCEEFFEEVGQYDTLTKAVSVSKAVGRIIAVISVEDIGQMHPSVAKSLAKTGMILGINYKGAV